jgi:hypothetical protein
MQLNNQNNLTLTIIDNVSKLTYTFFIEQLHTLERELAPVFPRNYYWK